MSTFAPFVLALDQPYPTEISAGGGYVYWTNSITSGNVMMLSLATVLAGGTPTPTLVTNEDLPRHRRERGASRPLSLSNVRRRLQSGEVGSITMAPSARPPPRCSPPRSLGSSELAVDSTNLFWLNAGTGVIQSNDLLADGPRRRQADRAHDPQRQRGGPRRDRRRERFTGTTASATILALSVNAAAGATPVTAANEGNTQGLVTDGARLYWLSGGNVVSTPVLGADLDAGLDGGVVTTLASAGSQPPGYLAVDGAYVY